MATKLGDLMVYLKMDKGQFESGINSAKRGVDDLGGSLAKLGIKLLGAQQAFAAWNRVASEQTSLNRLNATLGNLGISTTGLSRSVRALTKDWERFGIERVQSYANLQRLATATRDLGKATGYLNDAYRFAVKYGADASATADTVTRALSGQDRQLKMLLRSYGITITDGEELSTMFDKMREASKGWENALSAADSATINLKKSYNDLLDSMVEATQPALTRVMSGWQMFFRELESYIVDIQQRNASFFFYTGLKPTASNAIIDAQRGGYDLPPDRAPKIPGQIWTDPSSGVMYMINPDGTRRRIDTIPTVTSTARRPPAARTGGAGTAAPFDALGFMGWQAEQGRPWFGGGGAGSDAERVPGYLRDLNGQPMAWGDFQKFDAWAREFNAKRQRLLEIEKEIGEVTKEAQERLVRVGSEVMSGIVSGTMSWKSALQQILQLVVEIAMRLAIMGGLRSMARGGTSGAGPDEEKTKQGELGQSSMGLPRSIPTPSGGMGGVPAMVHVTVQGDVTRFAEFSEKVVRSGARYAYSVGR